MTLEKHQLEGGFIQVKKKLWRGVIRTRDDKTTIWTCKHNHSRPEFNARYAKEVEKKTRQSMSGHKYLSDTQSETEEIWAVWEASALNCGRTAYRQWMPSNQKVTGYIGDQGDPDLPFEVRPDKRRARVEKTIYVGTVELTSQGKRVLSVKANDIKGSINLDLPPKKGLTIPTDVETEEALKLVTAIWLLKGGIWGVMFQDHKVDMEAEGVLKEAVSQLLEDDENSRSTKKGLSLPKQYEGSTKHSPSRKTSSKKLLEAETSYEPSSQPRIEVRHKGGSRLYEVVDTRGVVIEGFHHRGKATKALSLLKGEER